MTHKTKTYSYDKRGEWVYTWRNGKIIKTELNEFKKQPKRIKKKGLDLLPGQFT